MNTSITSSITDGQKKQYKRFVEDIADRALAEANLDKDGIQELLEKGDEFQADILASIKKHSVSNQQELLRKLTSAKVSGAKRFAVDDAVPKERNVGWTGDTFNRLFKGKVEENVPACVIAVHRLERASLDAPIMAELGDHAEIQLAHFFELLKKQSDGEAGVLLVSGYANIAYIRGTDENFWAVRARWDYGYRCWRVEAYSVEDPRRWGEGHQLLSRDSDSL